MCNLFLSVSRLCCRLGFLVSLDNLLGLKLHLVFFVLQLPSLQSTWHLQRFAAVCYPSCCFCVTSLSTRLISACQLQSPFQPQLGVLLLSRQPSSLVLLPCVDDFQCPCFSSSVQLLSSRHCSLRTSRPAVGTALLACCWLCPSRLLLAVIFCLLLAILFCHFVPLSETVVDLLLVVPVLRLCAPFRQSGVASFVDFSSSLALLAVMLSLFSLFWRRLLQHYLVVVICSEVRLKHLQRHYSACATS